MEQGSISRLRLSGTKAATWGRSGTWFQLAEPINRKRVRFHSRRVECAPRGVAARHALPFCVCRGVRGSTLLEVTVQVFGWLQFFHGVDIRLYGDPYAYRPLPGYPHSIECADDWASPHAREHPKAHSSHSSALYPMGSISARQKRAENLCRCPASARKPRRFRRSACSEVLPC